MADDRCGNEVQYPVVEGRGYAAQRAVAQTNALHRLVEAEVVGHTLGCKSLHDRAPLALVACQQRRGGASL